MQKQFLKDVTDRITGGWKERVWGKGGPPEKKENVNCSRVYRKQKLSQAEDIVHCAEGFKGLVFQGR